MKNEQFQPVELVDAIPSWAEVERALMDGGLRELSPERRLSMLKESFFVSSGVAAAQRVSEMYIQHIAGIDRNIAFLRGVYMDLSDMHKLALQTVAYTHHADNLTRMVKYYAQFKPMASRAEVIDLLGTRIVDDVMYQQFPTPKHDAIVRQSLKEHGYEVESLIEVFDMIRAGVASGSAGSSKRLMHISAHLGLYDKALWWGRLPGHRKQNMIESGHVVFQNV